MATASLIISLLAIGLAAFSFWWLNWRPAKLYVATPPTYAGHGSEKLLLEFPFVFYNSGARPVVVDNLRLQLPTDGGEPLHFTATVEKLGTDEGRAFATPFFVGSRQAVKLICEFQRNPGKLTFKVREYTVQLDGRLNGGLEWEKLHSFVLAVTPRSLETLGTRLIAHENGA